MYKASTLKVSHKNHEDMDISDYLKSLNMQIIIHDRSESNYDHAIQLQKLISLILMALGEIERNLKYY